jgi:hypothetical protein
MDGSFHAIYDRRFAKILLQKVFPGVEFHSVPRKCFLVYYYCIGQVDLLAHLSTIHGLAKASFTVQRCTGWTLSRDEINCFAATEIPPQYSP